MRVISIKMNKEDEELCRWALSLSSESSPITRHKLMREILRDGFRKIIDNAASE